MSRIFKGVARMEGSRLNGREKELQYRQKETGYYGMIKVKTVQKYKCFKLEITYLLHCFQKHYSFWFILRILTQPRE